MRKIEELLLVSGMVIDYVRRHSFIFNREKTSQAEFSLGIFLFVLILFVHKYLSAYTVPKTALDTTMNKISKSLPSKSQKSSGGMQIINKNKYESNIGC